MKSKMLFFFIAAVSAALFSCSDDNEVKRKGDPDIAHNGEKWNITSINTYVVMDVSGTSVLNKTGSASNAGSFYFNDAENKGSFEFTVEGYNKEDYFKFTKDDAGVIVISSVEQAVGATTSVNIIVISGEQTSETEMVLDAVAIEKVTSTTGVFSFSAVSITLVKE